MSVRENGGRRSSFLDITSHGRALGVGLVGSLTCWLLGRSGAVADVDLLWMVVVMMVAYGLSVIIGQVRYS